MALKTANHVVKFTPEVWEEIKRVAKANRIDPSQVVDDVLAMAGDLDAVYDTPGALPAVPAKRERTTRAAVLEPSQVELDLEGLI